MLTLVVLFLCLSTRCSSFNLEETVRNLGSHFVSASELRTAAEALDTGLETDHMELVDIQESRDVDSTALKLQSETKQLNLKIVPSHKLIRPNAKLRVLDGDFQYEEKISPHLRSAFYHGFVDDEDRGSVALAKTETGWTGLVETPLDNYILHSVPGSQYKHLLVKMNQSDLFHMDDYIIDDATLLRDDEDDMTEDEADTRASKDDFELELGVYADDELYKKAEETYPNESPKTKLQEILLILLNTVHVFYQKASTGTKITIVLAQMIIMKHPQGDLSKSTNATAYLFNFCEWDHKQNPVGEHYDIGLMLTGLKISSKGVAFLQGACRHNKGKSCAVARGNQYIYTVTIAHEIGHSLGMNHDGKKNNCSPKKNIMGTKRLSGIADFSECSKNYLTKYIQLLDDFGFNCMRDEGDSTVEHTIQGELPGERIPASEQCHILYGDGYNEDISDPKFCAGIVCRSGRWVNQRTDPPLPGTPCGDNKICYDAKCQDKSSVERIISNYKHTNSAFGRSKLSLDSLCQKYVPDHPIGVNYNWMNDNGYSIDLSNLCSGSLLCFNKKKLSLDSYSLRPAPPGTSCAAGKRCKDYKCQ